MLRHLVQITAIISTVATLSVVVPGCASPPATTASEQSSRFGPWTPTRKGNHPGHLRRAPDSLLAPSPSETTTAAPAGPVATTAHIFWRLYTRTLSRSMGETCRFTPSCSRFAVEALAEGPEALYLIFARLQRGHLDDGTYEKTMTGHLADPVWNYFFWRSELGLHAHRSDLRQHQAWYVFVEQRGQFEGESLHD